MDGRKSFPHDLFMRVHPKVKLLKALLHDSPGMEVYGRLCALLEVLYTMGNKVPIGTGCERMVLCDELGLDSCDDLESFLAACADAGWVDPEPLAAGIVSSHNVQEQIDFKNAKSDAGRKGGRPRKSTAKSTWKTTC